MKNALLFSFVILLLISFVGCKEKKSTEVVDTLKEAEKEFKTVELDGYKINYVDIGEGKPVVFVHGGVGDYRTWEAQMEAFEAKYRVIAISRRYAYPNKQEADTTNDFSVTQHVKDLSRFLKILDLGPVHLVGHSYGAYTSLMTTLENPELVKTLTLGEPPVMSFLQYIPDGEKLGSDFAMNVMIPTAEAFSNGFDEKAVELFIGGVLTDSLYYSNASQKMKDLMMDNAFGLKGVALTENPFPPLGCEDVKKLKVPTLLIKGDRSPKILTAISDELANCIDNNGLKVLPNSSHGLEYENPEDFNTMVLDFIEKY